MIGQRKAEKQEAEAHSKLDLAYNKRPFPILSCDEVHRTFDVLSCHFLYGASLSASNDTLFCLEHDHGPLRHVEI